jgi:GGDEF domain-containing protein
MGLARCARRLAAALLLLAAVGGPPAFALEPVRLDSARQPQDLGSAGEAWIDPTGEAIAENVVSDPKLAWAPTREGAIYPLTTGKALWIRFRLAPPAEPEHWYLEVPYPSVNKVTLYTPDITGEWVPQSAGDRLPVADWPVPHRQPLLPLVNPTREPRPFLVRVENGHSFGAPLMFVSERHVNRTEQQMALVLGIYFGLAALAVTLSTVAAVTLRDRAYAHYASMVALMALTQASITGVAGLHLWPRLPWWNDLAALMLPVLGVGSLIAFASAVASIRQRSSRLYRLLTVASVAAVPIALAIAFSDPSLRFRLMVPYIVVASHLALGALLWASLRGDRYAPWVLAGSLPVAIGAAFPLARTLGLIPSGFWSTHGMQVGIAIELPVLLVILMLRSQQRREHHRRIQGLVRIDPATGLINAHVFHERLVRLISRSVRLKIRSAVLLVDIVNMEQIRREFDRELAEELPLRAAGRLLAAARDIDSVARLGEHRFGLLLEGPLKADEVAEAAPRVVARCLMPFKGRPLNWAPQVHVAQALIPMDGTDAAQLVGQLEMLLASAPPDSKRTVYLLSRPSQVGVPAAATAS